MVTPITRSVLRMIHETPEVPTVHEPISNLTRNPAGYGKREVSPSQRYRVVGIDTRETIRSVARPQVCGDPGTYGGLSTFGDFRSQDIDDLPDFATQGVQDKFWSKIAIPVHSGRKRANLIGGIQSSVGVAVLPPPTSLTKSASTYCTG